MGQLIAIKIKSKEDSEIDKFNVELEKLGIDNSFTAEHHNVEWVDDINNNPDSPQAHLKPITLEKLLETFPKEWTEIGVMAFDVAFGRTSQEEIEKYLKFIKSHVENIEYINNGDDIIERYNLSEEETKLIKKLTKEKKEPKKLPKDQRTKQDIQSGVLLCKSWGLDPFWVAYGSVERPTFMKNKIYENDLYNNLYKTKEGLAVMLIPLHELGKPNFVEKVMEEAWKIGLREHPAYFLPMVYNVRYMLTTRLIEEVADFYTVEELEERLKTALEKSKIYSYMSNPEITRDKNGLLRLTGVLFNNTYKNSNYKFVTDLLTRAVMKKNNVRAWSVLSEKL